VTSVEAKLKEDKAKRSTAESELKQVTVQIKQKQGELNKITKEYDSQLEAETEISLRIERCKQRLSELHAKQGRKGQFKSKKERDTFLKKQITDTKKTVAAEQAKV